MQPVAFTSFFRSPLRTLADISLVAGSRETDFRAGAMTSRLVHDTVLDSPYVAICLTKPDLARASQGLTAEVMTDHRL